MVRPEQQPIARHPAFEAAFQYLGFGTGMAQPGGDALTEFKAALADDDDGAADELGGPLRRRGGVA
jgi:hypothetical protein